MTNSRNVTVRRMTAQESADVGRKISRAEQEALGMIRPANYVAGKTGESAPVARAMSGTQYAAINQASHIIDVPPTATQHIEVKTSSVDRAKGFLISNVPLFAAFGVGVVLVSYIGFDVPFLSVPTLVIFWLSFVGAWLISYIYTLTISAEGTAHYEARQKWNVIKREQQERWNYYKRLQGGE